MIRQEQIRQQGKSWYQDMTFLAQALKNPIRIRCFSKIDAIFHQGIMRGLQDAFNWGRPITVQRRGRYLFLSRRQPQGGHNERSRGEPN